MSSKKAVSIQSISRAGEGVALHTTYVSVGGLQGANVSIDLTRAPVPERRYTADVATLLCSDSLVRMIFGQTKVDRKELRSIVDIHMSRRAVVQLLDSINATGDTLKNLQASLNFPTANLIDIADEPSQTVGLSASVVAAAYANEEACLDFYHVSSFVMAHLQRNTGANVVAEPVVRVILPTPLLIAIVERMKDIKATMPNETQRGGI